MRNYTLVGLLFLLFGCNTVKLPTTKYQAYPVEYLLQVANDSLYISINNQLKCPVRILLPDTILNQRLEQNGFAIIEPQGKKKYSVFLDGQTSYSRGIQWRLGAPVVKPNINQFTLPFANGKAYKIIELYI